jgi:hypothetical protein
MGIENLKRWHWCVIGVVAGFAFAAVKVWAGPDESDKPSTVAPEIFEKQLLFHHDLNSSRAVVKIENIRVHAPREFIRQGSRDKVMAEYISYDAYLLPRPPQPPRRTGRNATTAPAPAPTPAGPPKAELYRFFMVMQEQLPIYRSVLGSDVSKMQIREYLEKLKEKIKSEPTRYPKVPPLEWKYNWLESERAAYTVYPSAGLVIVGLIWPTLINALAGAGWGRPPKEKDEFDLSKFKGSKQHEKAKAAVKAGDLEQLAKLEAELEANLKAGAKPRVATPAVPVAPEAPVKVLNAGKLETAKEAPKTDAPRKGFGADQGDYYPTEVHGKKKT